MPRRLVDTLRTGPDRRRRPFPTACPANASGKAPTLEMDVSQKPARPRPAPRHTCRLRHSCRRHGRPAPLHPEPDRSVRHRHLANLKVDGAPLPPMIDIVARLVTAAGSFFNAATIGELITPSPQRGRRPAWPPSRRYCAQSVIAINYRIICPGPRRYRWAPPSDDDAGHNV